MKRSFRSWRTRVLFLLLPVFLLVSLVDRRVVNVPFAWAATGSINQQISYQAKLMDNNGVTVADGTYNLIFNIYTQAVGGTPVWTAKGSVGSPSALSVTVTNGLFTVMLGDTSVGGGSQNALTGIDWNNDALYLGLTVNSDAEMTPRKHIGAVPQAFNAQLLQGMSPSSTVASGNSLFTLNQTNGDAAASARSALEIRSSGLSDTNDYLIRGINSSSSVAFSVSRTGLITGSGFASTGPVSGLIGAGSLTLATSTAIGTMTQPTKMVAQGRYGYVLSTARGLDIVDLSGVSGQGSIGNVFITGLNQLAVIGNMAFMSDDSSLYTVDVSNPTSPTIVATNSGLGSGGFAGLTARGSTLYFVKHGFLQAVDASDPMNLRQQAFKSVSPFGDTDTIAVQGNVLYVSDAEANTVRLYDISVPTSFTLLSTISLTLPGTLAVQGSLLMVRTVVANTMVLYDVSKPTAPALLSTTAIAGTYQTDNVLRGRYAFVAKQNGVTYSVIGYDIQNPRTPVALTANSFDEFGFAQLHFDVANNTVYALSSTTLYQYNLTQMETTGLKAATADIGALNVRNDSFFEGKVTANQGLNVTHGLSADELAMFATSSAALVQIKNSAATTTDTAWGAYINSLLVGASASATGTKNYRMVVGYNPTQTRGICIDDLSTPGTCPSTLDNTSIIAEHAITAGGFDLAERYDVTGDVVPGDVLTIDNSTSTHARKSAGIPYDPNLMGVASTAPGLVLGFTTGTEVALSGRVPTAFSPINGPVAIGDPLTSSIYPGVAMKATQPGKIIGHALQASDTTSTIEVFINVGYDAGSFLNNDGASAVTHGNLVIGSTASATTDVTTTNSWGVTWRGSAWDGTTAQQKDFTLMNQGIDATHSLFSLMSGTSTLWSVDQSGSMRVKNDLLLGGRFFPATRTGAQTDKYLFLDDTGPASSTYIATNADGWQANDSYDFAERYYSPDALEPGDVVVISQRGEYHVQRTMTDTDVPIGIVSTKAAFVAGAPATSTYPIALAGSVPTKVSSMNGGIAIGDALAASSMPGVVVKATKSGPIVGYALEAYTANDIGKIQVFVNTGWWGGAPLSANGSLNISPETAGSISTSSTSAINATSTPKVYQGIARILPGGTHVHVMHPTLGSFPLIQVTPYGMIEGGWWTDHSSDVGFDIYLKAPLGHDATFSWRAEEMLPADDQLFLSDGTTQQWDIHSGDVIYHDATSTVDVATTTSDTTSTDTTVSTSTDMSAPVVTTASSTPSGSTTTTASASAPQPTPDAAPSAASANASSTPPTPPVSIPADTPVVTSTDTTTTTP